MLFRSHHIVPEGFTVFDVAAMGRTVTLGRFGRLSLKDRERIDAALQLAGADPLRERLCCRLSGGEQQRVLLARALAQDTPIMVLDEPTAFLDLHYQVHILELVRSISRTRSVGVLPYFYGICKTVFRVKLCLISYLFYKEAVFFKRFAGR